MKYYIAIIGLLLSFNCFGQIDSILNETLDKEEYNYLNSNLNTEKYNYDFTDKKVAFFSSPGGTILRSKSDFFRIEDGVTVGFKYFDIVIFSEKQKSKHDYDVAVIYVSKNTQPKVSKRLERIVRKNNRAQSSR